MTKIADLFVDAGKRLRAEFQFIRESNPHSGDKGEEVELVLADFLNKHMPKRFSAGSGVIIDFDDDVIRQTDVIVYDAQSSPLYRVGDKTLIVPYHTTAAVVEVKSRLSKKELEDRYKKIASVKRLKKPPLGNVDMTSTPSGLDVTGTMGVIFGFDSDVSLETLAEHAAELNSKYESSLWPDVIVSLDQGVITYAVQWPGQDLMAATLGTRPSPGEGRYYPPPWFVHLLVHEDGELTLNRFFLLLLMQLAFYPHRHGTPSFETMLRASSGEAMTMAAYQMTSAEQLAAVSEELYLKNDPKVEAQINLSAPDGSPVGVLQYFPWPNGGVVRGAGVPLQLFLQKLHGDPRALVMDDGGGMQITNILPLSIDQFLKWPDDIQKHTKLQAVLEGD